jgi:glycosyl transferase, family 25
MQLDGILVVNPRNFLQRRASIERQLSGLGLSFEFIHDFDISDITQQLEQRYFAGADMRQSQKSCALKHRKAHALVAERGWKRALILEDDVLLAPDFTHGLQAALQEGAALPEPKVIFLGHGGNFYTPRSRRVPGQHLYLAHKGRFGDSYLIGAQTAQLRLNWMDAHGIGKPTDNLFDQIDPLLGIQLYWLEEPVVEQGSKNGLFTSTLEPLPPRPIQAFKFAMEKFRRKYLYQLWR